ncbi:MAG: Flp pilus assembly protein CpaB [Acidobacteria bacterium]|nr:Flp pilus assembly protein CpaB [Acidobacteriota bacterium]
MLRVRIALVVVIALSAGVGLAYGTYNYLQQAPVRTVETPTQAVVVAATDLALGTALRRSDLRVVNWPVAHLPEGAFSRIEELEGRGLVVAMVKNEVILDAKLAAKEAGAGLPPIIPAGMRALSVRVNEVIGVAGYVLPGTRVDVVATASPTDKKVDTTSKVVLANVQVLTAGTRLEKEGDGKPTSVNVVTLLVTPEQAERLALASTEGKIQLALRNPLDDGAPPTPGIKPPVLLGTSSVVPRPRLVARRSVEPPAPAPPPPPPPVTVEIIRGDKREIEVIK